MHSSLIGYGRFGKIDGFQWLDREGLLTDFQAPASLTILGHLLALRQESIRPFVGEDILGLTELLHAGQKIRFVSLYRYALGHDKRDGYLAATIGFRQSSAAPAEIMLTLEALLQGQAWQADFLPSLQQQAAPLSPAEPGEGVHTAFVALNDSHTAADLIADYWRNAYFLYRWVYASQGVQTLLSLEHGSAAVDILNPGHHQTEEAGQRNQWAY